MSRLKTMAIVIAALSSLCAALARADSASEAVPDVRCLIVGMYMRKSDDGRARAAGLGLALFHFGRLDARESGPNLEELNASEAMKMTPADLKSEAARCGSEADEKGKQLQLIGQHLVQRGQQQQGEKQGQSP
jgi:hypothetical protein